MGARTPPRRRAEPKKPPNPTGPPHSVLRVVVGAGGTGLVLGLVIGSFSAAGIVDMTVAAGMLIGAWIVGAIAISFSEPVWGLPKRYRLATTLLSNLALAALLAGVGYYQYKHLPTKEIKNARLEFNGVEVVQSKKDPDISLIFPHLQNRGGISSRGNHLSFVAGAPEALLSDKEEDDAINGVSKELLVIPAPTNTGNEMPSNENGFSENIPDRWIKNSAWAEVKDSKRYLFIALIAKYTDESLPAGSYFVTEICVYTQGALTSWRKCHDHNRIYRVN